MKKVFYLLICLVSLVSCSHKASDLECYLLQDSINNYVNFDSMRVKALLNTDYYPDSIKYNFVIKNNQEAINIYDNDYGFSPLDTISIINNDKHICVFINDYVHFLKRKNTFYDYCIQNNKPFSFAQQECKKLWDDFVTDAIKKEDVIKSLYNINDNEAVVEEVPEDF